jgi:Metallo-peptidase family M12
MAFAAALQASRASGAPLLVRAGRGALTGVHNVQRLALDRSALAELRGLDEVTIASIPLGDRRDVELVLRRFEPFAAGLRIDVMDANGSRTAPLPDRAYFKGTVVGDDESLVFLAAGRDRVHGFVVSAGDVYPFGPDGHGRHRSYALRDVDPTVHRPPGDFCANDLHPEQVETSAALAALAAPPPEIAATHTTLKQADIAIETDYELRAKFGTDALTLDYLSSLAAAATAIYERDVAVRLRFSYIRLWTTPADPWTATSTSGALTELRNYWNDAANNMAAIAGPRTVAHFVSGKGVQGGIAFLNVLCNTNAGYGVSQVYGGFDLSSPDNIWDVEVVTHELGHNFGSPHSHCYSPPIDKCYNQESNCYAGPVVASRGTIMSYCHLLAGGLANMDLLFGSTVSTRIGQSVAAASCLTDVPMTTTTTTPSTSTTSTITTSTSTTTTSTVTTSTTSTVTTSTATTTTSTTSTVTTSTSTTSTVTTTTSTSTTSTVTTSTATTSTSTTTSTVTTSSTSTSTTSSSSTSTVTTSTATTSTVTTSTVPTTTSTTTSTVTTSSTSTSTTSTVTTSTATTSTVTTSTSTTTTSTVTTSSTSTVTTSTATTSTSTTTTTTSTTTLVVPSTSTSTTLGRPSSTTTLPSVASTDGDGDGVSDSGDACTGTPRGDLVDGIGCPVCPCSGPVSGGVWSARSEYVRCMRSEVRRRMASGLFDPRRRRAALERTRRSTCGRPESTRCCSYRDASDTIGRCRLTRVPVCATRVTTSDAADVGPGSCVPSPCAR